MRLLLRRVGHGLFLVVGERDFFVADALTLDGKSRHLLRVQAECGVFGQRHQRRQRLGRDVALNQRCACAGLALEVALRIGRYVGVLHAPGVVPLDLRLKQRVVGHLGNGLQRTCGVGLKHRHPAHCVWRAAHRALQQQRQAGKLVGHLQRELDDGLQLLLGAVDHHAGERLTNIVNLLVRREVPPLAALDGVDPIPRRNDVFGHHDLWPGAHASVFQQRPHAGVQHPLGYRHLVRHPAAPWLAVHRLPREHVEREFTRLKRVHADPHNPLVHHRHHDGNRGQRKRLVNLILGDGLALLVVRQAMHLEATGQQFGGRDVPVVVVHLEGARVEVRRLALLLPVVPIRPGAALRAFLQQFGNAVLVVARNRGQFAQAPPGQVVPLENVGAGMNVVAA